jgi:hypothetical protein
MIEAYQNKWIPNRGENPNSLTEIEKYRKAVENAIEKVKNITPK